MDRLIKSIDKQIEFNKGKNIFLDEPALFKFIDDTVNAISLATARLYRVVN